MMNIVMFVTAAMVLIGASLLLDMSLKMRNHLVGRADRTESDIVPYFYRASVAIASVSACVVLCFRHEFPGAYIAFTHDEQTRVIPLLYIVYLCVLVCTLSFLHIGGWLMRSRAHTTNNPVCWNQTASIGLNYVIAASTLQTLMLYIVT